MAELARALQSQNIWFQAAQYKEAEIKLVRHRMGMGAGDAPSAPSTPVTESAPAPSKASAMISELKKELTTDSNNAINDISGMLDRVVKLEKENDDIKAQLQAALARLDQLESAKPAAAAPVAAAPAAKKQEESEDEDDDDDDDMDFFGSDDDEVDEEAERVKAERVAAYNAKKAAKVATKGAVAAKSMITLDVKPFDDETDLDALAIKIKSEIVMDGLVWGGKHEKKPLAFGIFKLVVTAVVEDEKVSTDDLTEKIEEYEDEVQSVDIAAFNKL